MGIDYEYLAASLSSLAGLPVRLYRDGEFAGLYHHTKFKPDLAIFCTTDCSGRSGERWR